MRDDAVTVAALLDAAAARLGDTLGLARREARLEARALAAFAWKVPPAWTLAHDTDLPDPSRRAAFTALLAARLAGRPLAYLTGQREFYGRDFMVTPDVLIPRPDTELLIDLALARLPANTTGHVLDLGTGSGCLAITLACERPAARVTAVDRSPAALAVARGNAGRCGANVEFLESDWFTGLAGRRFDLVVANPPYIAAADPHLAHGDVRHEPLAALVSGPDGLDDLTQLIQAAARHLEPGGSLLLEHGWNQAVAVRARLTATGYGGVKSWNDLAGIARVSGGHMSK